MVKSEGVEVKREDSDAVVRKHVVVNFIKRNNIRLRARQRHRKFSKDNFWSAVMNWHSKTRERLIRRGKDDGYDAKWGRFIPEQRFNVDQSPCPLAINVKKTYEIIESGDKQNRYHKVWV